MTSKDRVRLLRPSTTEVVPIGDAPLTVDMVLALAEGRAKPVLTAGARDRMAESYAVVQHHLQAGQTIYGVTTGVGASVETSVDPARSAELSLNILRMHGCGTGRTLDDTEAAAVLAVRLSSLSRGCSGVRPVVAEHLVRLLEERVLPVIPCEGSVGASGDLTPLSYVAAVLVGEREVRHEGEVVPADKALRAIGLPPLQLAPKEALALMNGTAVATAIGCIAWARSRRVARLSSTITAMASEAIRGNPEHFDAFIHATKPHPGQVQVARWIRSDLGIRPDRLDQPARLQDRYSIRCAPHVIGVLVDALAWSRQILETELNGVSDNPVVDTSREAILHGGNFYGGHVGFAMDSLKAAVASCADLLDRQLMLLCSPAESGGLPENLVGVEAARASTFHGFKAMGITASALTAEALKLTMPAAAFSRSTELHNQDKVPMATIASRDLLRIVELTEQVAAVCLLAGCQALDLRGIAAWNRVAAVHAAVRERVPKLVEDRRMDHDIAATLELMRSGGLPIDVAGTA